MEFRKQQASAGPIRHAGLALAALTILLMVALVPGAGADNGTVTFTSTSTFPVPPVSNFTGSGGGDGWGVALTPTAVYNVFHHSPILQVACHYQTNVLGSDGKTVVHAAASPCWGPNNEAVQISTVENDRTINFTASGQPGMYLDQSTGKLYVYTTRSTDNTAGVVCIDTKAMDPALNPAFDPSSPSFAPDGRLGYCGFTALSAVGEAPNSSYADLGAPALVGSHWFAFNYVNGQGTNGTYNHLLCFDVKSLGPCAGQPYQVFSTGDSTVTVSTPGPSIAAVGSKIIVPFRVGSSDGIACFDTTATDPAQASCGWAQPTDITGYASGFGYGQHGPPFPMLSATGTPTGFCLSTGTDPCFDLTGAHVNTPPNMTSAIQATEVWNGPAVVVGPRVYLANRFGGGINCYDYSTQSTCQLKDANGNVQFSYPLSLADSTDWYTVNADPQRPTCLWANSDHRQIANFDAFTGGACGQGPIRVRTDQLVGSSPQCFPSKFTTLKIDDPARSAYSDGTVVFADASGNPLQGATPISLDATGTADLSSLQLSTDQALPQFVITLNNGDAAFRPQSVTVTVTWTGTFDPTCASGTTTVVNPPTNNPPSPSPSVTPTPNIGVTASAPPVARVGNNVTFTATVTNTSSNELETGSQLTAPFPAGSTIVSATSTQGVCQTYTQIFCGIGTLDHGASATITVVVKANTVGTLTFNPTIAGDYDTNSADNNASVSTPVEEAGATPPAPPAPTTPGTFNAISVGTVVVNGQTIPPDTVFTIKTGDTVQLNGTLVFTTIGGSVGIFSNVPFTGSRSLSGYLAQLRAAESGPTVTFTVTAPQTASDGTNLTIAGGDYSGCTSPRTLSAKPRSTVIQQLWGKAHGKFTTTGKYSSATIRGTTWGVTDRCDGTLTTAVDDVVTVVDNVLNKTVTLDPGQTYLAQPAAFKPPTLHNSGSGAKHANSVASVRASGLRWGGRVFKTEAAFSEWLSSRGSSWQAWAKRHRVIAAALATR